MPTPEPTTLEGLQPVTQILVFITSLALGIFMWLVSWWNKQGSQPPLNLISVENEKLRTDIEESLRRFSEQMDKQISQQFAIVTDAADVLSGRFDSMSERLRLIELSVARLEVKIQPRR